MLTSSNVAQGSSVRSNPPWNGEEWLQIATQLKRSHPERHFISYRSTPFSCIEVEEAAEAVLASSRHRAVSHFDDIRADLFSAFKQASNTIQAPVKEVPKARSSPQRVVKWSPEEWELIVKELYACHPELFDRPQDLITQFSAHHFRRAQLALNTDRHRELKHREDVAQQFLKVWLDHGDRLKAELLEKRKVKEFSNAIIPGPLHSAANEQKQMSAAIQKAFEAPDKPVKEASKKYATAKPIRAKKPRKAKEVRPVVPANVKGKHKRNNEYWRAMALTLIAQHPKLDLLDTDVPVRFSISDLTKAQKAVPAEMHRKTMYPYLLMPELNEEFKLLKSERDAVDVDEIAEEAMMQEEESRDEVQEIAQKETNPSKQADARSAEAYQHKAYVETLQSVEAAPMAEALGGQKTPYVQALEQKTAELVQLKKAEEPQSFGAALIAASAPLLNVIMGKLASMIVPELTKALMPEITKAIVPEITAAIGPAILQQIRPALNANNLLIHDIICQEVAVGVSKIPMPKEVIKVVEKVVERTVHVPMPSVSMSAREAQQAPIEALTGPVVVPKVQVEETPRLPVIAVIGPMGNQKTDLERSYPNIAFIFIQGGHGIKEAAKKAGLWVVSTKHNPRQVSTQIKANVNRDLVFYVDGGTSAFKREIDRWIKEKGETV